MKTLLRLLVGLLVAAATSRAAESLFIRLPIGRAVMSLPAHWRSLGPEIPAWLHLHGATETVEREFATIGAPGALVTLTLPGLSKVYADHFADPAVFSRLLQDLEAALRQAAPGTAWTLGRLTVSSFSAGFGGVRQLLRQPEAATRIAVLVLADSLYCGYAGDPRERRVDPALMEDFVRFARQAVHNSRRMLVTHTEQKPAGYASTTETADYLLARVGGTRQPRDHAWKAGLREASHFASGGLEIIGFAGENPEDHLEHLRSLGLFLARVR